MTPDSFKFTAAQEEAFDKIARLMQEYFDAGTFMVEVTSEMDSSQDIRRGSFHGGGSRAMGLCRIQERRIYDQDREDEGED